MGVEDRLQQEIDKVMELAKTAAQVMKYQRGDYNEGLGIGVNLEKAARGLTLEEVETLVNGISFISDPEVKAFIRQENLRLGGEDIGVESADASTREDTTLAFQALEIRELSPEEKRLDLIRKKIDILRVKSSGIAVSSTEELTDDEIAFFEKYQKGEPSDIPRKFFVSQEKEKRLPTRERQSRELNELMRQLTKVLAGDPGVLLLPEALRRINTLVALLGVELSLEARQYINSHIEQLSQVPNPEGTEILEIKKEPSEKPAKKGLWSKWFGK
jgi:hypothetical protein